MRKDTFCKMCLYGRLEALFRLDYSLRLWQSGAQCLIFHIKILFVRKKIYICTIQAALRQSQAGLAAFGLPVICVNAAFCVMET